MNRVVLFHCLLPCFILKTGYSPVFNKGVMINNLKQIVNILQYLAPSTMAENWDNVGLQIGGMDWEVNKIWTALDPTLKVVEHACNNKVDLLITHHPLFFKNLTTIDTNTSKGQVINLALKNRLAIFCAHTNLDNVSGGINDVLANQIGLENISVMRKFLSEKRLCKLVVFCPTGSEQAVMDAIFSVGAGKIGNYSCCSFRNKGLGTFLPEKKSNPYVGNHGLLSELEEIRVESIISRQDIKLVINAVKKVHPYETLPYDIYPIIIEEKSGIGRIGNLRETTTLKDFVKQVKSDLNISTLKISGNQDMLVKSVAICSGSGSSFIEDFFKSGAQVYVSGDINYHNARDAEDLGLGIIDIGHFCSEKFAIVNLTKKIENIIRKIDINISISTVDIESDVFEFI